MRRRSSKGLGASRGVHAERVAHTLRVYRYGAAMSPHGTCRNQLTKLRQVERDLQGARAHAVAAGGRTERATLHKIDKLQKQLTKRFDSWAKDCLRGG